MLIDENTTGTEIRALREGMHITQEEFAHQIHVTVSTVNRWENGHSKPSKLARQMMEQVLNPPNRAPGNSGAIQS